MAQLYVGNVNFESTGNSQFIYSANTITVRVDGINVLTVNSTSVINATGITANYIGDFANLLIIPNGQLIVNTDFEVTGGVIINSNVTPTVIAANTADWAPGISNVYTIRVSANNSTANAVSEFMITGMTAGTNGQLVALHNIGSAGIWIRNEEAGSNGAILPANNTPSSTDANRFNLPSHFKLQGYQSATFYYDGPLSRWRLTDSTSIPFSVGNILNTSKGFFSGGSFPPATASAVTDRTIYSSETTAAVTGANLTQARQGAGAAGNSDKGFFAGGATPSTRVATSDRSTFSTETTAAVSGTNLSGIRAFAGAKGNGCKGFFNGGDTPTVVDTSDRIDYVTETRTSVAGANLNTARSQVGSVGNICKGFFIGGGTPTVVATACRTTYSTETTAAVAGANYTAATFQVGNASNACKGFSSGGYSPATPTTTTKTCRTTFSTETTASVPGATLSQTRAGIGAAGNVCKGFFTGGGIPGTAYSTSDRITYSTETFTAVPGANLSQSRFNLNAI